MSNHQNLEWAIMQAEQGAVIASSESDYEYMKHEGQWYYREQGETSPFRKYGSEPDERGLWRSMNSSRMFYEEQNPKPEPDYKAAFLDAMEWVDEFFGRYRETLEHPANAADYREIQRIRTLRDAAKGETK